MGETRKVIVNGEEFEVELEQDGEIWKATVGGETFEINVPDAGPAPKKKRSSGGKSKKSGKVSGPFRVVSLTTARTRHTRSCASLKRRLGLLVKIR